METASKDFVLGEKTFPDRLGAINHLTTSIQSELAILTQLKKDKSSEIDPNIGKNETPNLTQNAMLLNINRCLKLLLIASPNEVNSNDLLNNMFAGSRRKPIVQAGEIEGDILEVANSLVVMTQLLREIHDITKDYEAFKGERVNLVASLLRERNKDSGVTIVERALNCYSKLIKFKGYKEWEGKNSKYKTGSYIDILHSLIRPHILDLLGSRDLYFTISYENFIGYLSLDIIDYSGFLRSQASIPET